MSNRDGTFVWYDLTTNDVAGSISFYRDVIGWGTQSWDGGGSPYTMWTVDKTPIGGVAACTDAARRAGIQPGWAGYVAVPHVDDYTKRAEQMGGRVVLPPEDIPTVGRFSVVADPHGAQISLFKGSGEEMPAPEGMPFQHVSWHELQSGNLDEAFRFYSELFGWQKGEAIPMPNGTYQIYAKGSRTLGGMMTRPQGYPYPPHWLYYVRVADIDATLEKVKKRGGTVLHGPVEVPGGARVAHCLDPQRIHFALQG